MHIIFIDDSGQRGKREGMGDLVSVGGIILPENKIEDFQDSLNKVCIDAGIPTNCEIKWSPPPESWIYKNLVKEDRENCYRDLLETARDCSAKVIVIVFDTGRTSCKKQAATLKALEFFIERARMYLEDNDALGIIVADQPSGGRKDESRFLSETLVAIQQGSEFVPPKQIPLNILTTPSRLIRPLQIADLVVGITTGFVGGYTKYTKPLFPIIKEMMIINSLSFIGGSGLKIFPESLTNLYWWVLGEECYGKASAMAGHSLPDQRYLYDKHEYKCF